MTIWSDDLALEHTFQLKMMQKITGQLKNLHHLEGNFKYAKQTDNLPQK